MDTITILAGISTILLAIELLVVVIVVGGVIYFIRYGIRAGRRAAAPYAQQAVEKIFLVEKLTKEYADVIVGTQIQAISIVRGVRRGLKMLLRWN